MSNIMNLKHLENKVHKNGFDLSSRNCFTAKVGELLPVYTDFLYPNKKVKIKPSSFTRTIPLNTAAFTRVREYYDFFFVPMRLLWRYSDQFYTQMRDSYGSISATENGAPTTQLPYFGRLDFIKKVSLLYQGRNSLPEAENWFKVERWATISKLAEYLDYGMLHADTYDQNALTQPVNDAITPFRFLAYQKIYYDYFRLSQWEKNEPKFYNIDYVNPKSPLLSSLLNTLDTETQTCFDLQYVNYNKDLFTGVLPTPQFGDTANASVSSDGGIATYRFTRAGSIDKADIDKGNIAMYNGLLQNQVSGSSAQNIDGLALYTDNLGKLSILALRQAEALQKWKEIAFSGNQDYRTQIKKHFGIDPGPVRSAICEHLGGFQNNIQISEVINQNLTADNVANIQGKGLSSGNGYIEFEAKEHGYLMCVYHAKPILDYAAVGLAPDVTKTYPQDFVIPEFDKIGMQTIPVNWLTCDLPFNLDKLTLGYAPRYAEFKTAVDKVHGAFNSTYKHWVAPWSKEYIDELVTALGFTHIDSSAFYEYHYNFFKVPPFAIDTILSVKSTAYPTSDSDHLICCADFDNDAIQPIDRDGLPY